MHQYTQAVTFLGFIFQVTEGIRYGSSHPSAVFWATCYYKTTARREQQSPATFDATHAWIPCSGSNAFPSNLSQGRQIDTYLALRSTFGERNRNLSIQHLKQPAEEMGPQIVSSPEADDVSSLTITTAEALAAAPDKTKVVPERIDVTKFIKADLALGHTSTTFRWRDVLAEKEGNSTGQPTGLTLARNGDTLPALVISLKP